MTARAFARRLREWSRRAVSIPARVSIFADRANRPFNTGTAIVRNISLSGCLLGRIVLKRKVLPASRFTVHIDFRLPGHEGIGAIGRPVHFGTGKEFEIGIAFEDFWVKE